MEEQSSVSLFSKIFIYTVAAFVDMAQFVVAIFLGFPAAILNIIEMIPAKYAGLAGAIVYMIQYLLGEFAEAMQSAHMAAFYALQAMSFVLISFAFFLIFKKMQNKLAKYEKIAADILYKKFVGSVARRLAATQLFKIIPIVGLLPINTIGAFLSLKVVQRIDKKEMQKIINNDESDSLYYNL